MDRRKLYQSQCCWFSLLVSLLTMAGPIPAAAERSIYRCVEQGVTVFSDRPCGNSSQSYSLRSGDAAAEPVVPTDLPVQPVTAKPTKQAAKASRASSRRPARAASDPGAAAKQAACVRVKAQLAQLRSRMRSGYRVAEGERLRERERAARERSRALRCR